MEELLKVWFITPNVQLFNELDNNELKSVIEIAKTYTNPTTILKMFVSIGFEPADTKEIYDNNQWRISFGDMGVKITHRCEKTFNLPFKNISYSSNFCKEYYDYSIEYYSTEKKLFQQAKRYVDTEMAKFQEIVECKFDDGYYPLHARQTPFLANGKMYVSCEFSLEYFHKYNFEPVEKIGAENVA